MVSSFSYGCNKLIHPETFSWLLLKEWNIFRAHQCLCPWFCRKGSVIVDVELTFDTKVGVSEVSALLEKVIQDGKLGEFQVSEEVVGSFITG